MKSGTGMPAKGQRDTRRPPRPEPTPDSGHDTYLVPRSKTPAKDALYTKLLAMGWRFDIVNAEWHTPYGAPLQGFGRLEYGPDMAWARIRPPHLPGQQLPKPLISFISNNGWEVAG